MSRRVPTIAAMVFMVVALFGPVAASTWDPPDIDKLTDDPWGRSVRLGRSLTVDTPVLLGPQQPDPAKRFAGNNLSCQSCHIAAGTAEYGLPFVGVFADFPQYRAREGQVGSLEDRINGCMARSMNGRPLPTDSAEMRGFVSYIKFLSLGVPVGAPTKGRGAADMPLLDRAADPARGAAIYANTCVACHGADGAGRHQDDGKGYLYPPLWGPDSFNDGAGMARLISAATFIRSNMPAGTTWREPVLSREDAWDVAAYVESQPRPHMAGLDHDFPVRRQNPADAAYGPFPDGFSPDQHRYGPFQPIKDAAAKQ